MWNYLLYRLGELLAVYLPSFLLYRLAETISVLHQMISTEDRENVRNNLKVIFPGISERLLRKYTKGVFINFGLYLANFLMFKKIGRAYIDKYFVVEGLDYVDKALSLKKGLIILSAHIGNWEAAGMAMAIMGYPMNAITLTHKDSRINRFFNRQRESKGFKVIPMGRAVRGCLEAFNRNEIVCILGDRDFTQGGIAVDLFGRQAIIPKGAGTFFLRNNVPVVMAFAAQENAQRFRLEIRPMPRINLCGDFEKDLQSFSKAYIAQIEDYIRKHPSQWAMFRKFWM